MHASIFLKYEAEKDQIHCIEYGFMNNRIMKFKLGSTAPESETQYPPIIEK